MVQAWIMFWIFMFLAVNSLCGAASKWPGAKKEKRSNLAVSMVVSVIILAWGFFIVANLFGMREQLAPEGLGLALCLIMTYQGMDPFFVNDEG